MPAEAPYLTLCRKRAVCGDWMVETVWLELAAPHPVLSKPRLCYPLKTLTPALTGAE